MFKKLIPLVFLVFVAACTTQPGAVSPVHCEGCPCCEAVKCPCAESKGECCKSGACPCAKSKGECCKHGDCHKGRCHKPAGDSGKPVKCEGCPKPAKGKASGR